jgi:3'-phosphoadenosine 5'-phosphosulfate sulfotransferase (PAPS reductase)/FAD synthetase
VGAGCLVIVPLARLRVVGPLPSPIRSIGMADIERPAPTALPELGDFDLIVVSTSGGKDSQVALDVAVAEARKAGVLDRVTAVHADLGDDEWECTTDLVRLQAERYGVPLVICSRIGQVIAAWRERTGEKRARRVLSVQGLRADESSRRAKRVPFELDAAFSSARREVWTWLPIHRWSARDVWGTIRDSGAPYHWAYDVGMPRLSCSLCIFAPESALVLAGHYNRARLVEKADLEVETGDTFKIDLALGDVLAQVDAGVWPSVDDWTM